MKKVIVIAVFLTAGFGVTSLYAVTTPIEKALVSHQTQMQKAMQEAGV